MFRPPPILAVCAGFVGGFYAAMLPLWEGVEEWAHLSVIQAVQLSALEPKSGR